MPSGQSHQTSNSFTEPSTLRNRIAHLRSWNVPYRRSIGFVRFLNGDGDVIWQRFRLGLILLRHTFDALYFLVGVVTASTHVRALQPLTGFHYDLALQHGGVVGEVAIFTIHAPVIGKRKVPDEETAGIHANRPRVAGIDVREDEQDGLGFVLLRLRR